MKEEERKLDKKPEFIFSESGRLIEVIIYRDLHEVHCVKVGNTIKTHGGRRDGGRDDPTWIPRATRIAAIAQARAIFNKYAKQPIQARLPL